MIQPIGVMELKAMLIITVIAMIILWVVKKIGDRDNG